MLLANIIGWLILATIMLVLLFAVVMIAFFLIGFIGSNISKIREFGIKEWERQFWEEL